MTKPVPPFAEWYATKEAEAKALDRATQALKDAAVAHASCGHLPVTERMFYLRRLERAAEDYADLYLKRGGK